MVWQILLLKTFKTAFVCLLIYCNETVHFVTVCCLATEYMQYKMVYFPHKILQSGISSTLRSGLREIPTMIRTFPHGLEDNHACQWTSDNFPGMLTYVIFLENCQKTVCMHGYSPIHVNRSLKVSNLGDKSVPYF